MFLVARFTGRMPQGYDEADVEMHARLLGRSNELLATVWAVRDFDSAPTSRIRDADYPAPCRTPPLIPYVVRTRGEVAIKDLAA